MVALILNGAFTPAGRLRIMTPYHSHTRNNQPLDIEAIFLRSKF